LIENSQFLAQLGVIEPSSSDFVPFFEALAGATITTSNRTGQFYSFLSMHLYNISNVVLFPYSEAVCFIQVE
jgi:hypothetical protein